MYCDLITEITFENVTITILSHQSRQLLWTHLDLLGVLTIRAEVKAK